MMTVNSRLIPKGKGLGVGSATRHLCLQLPQSVRLSLRFLCNGRVFIPLPNSVAFPAAAAVCSNFLLTLFYLVSIFWPADFTECFGSATWTRAAPTTSGCTIVRRDGCGAKLNPRNRTRLHHRQPLAPAWAAASSRVWRKAPTVALCQQRRYGFNLGLFRRILSISIIDFSANGGCWRRCMRCDGRA